MREQQAQFGSVERAAGPGDLVIMDYTLAIEGQEPSSQVGYAFLVGDGSVLPEVDQAVSGMRAGDGRTVNFRCPDDHRREERRGKARTPPLKIVAGEEKG